MFAVYEIPVGRKAKKANAAPRNVVAIQNAVQGISMEDHA